MSKTTERQNKFDIFEAVIHSVQGNLCTISKIDSTSSDLISEVPLPNLSGNRDSGFHLNYSEMINTRVLILFSPSVTRNAHSIICIYPEDPSSSASGLPPMDTPAGTCGSPVMSKEPTSPAASLSGPLGSGMRIDMSGSIFALNGSNLGLSIMGRERGSTMYSAAHTIINYSNAHNTTSGTAIRVLGNNRTAHNPSSLHNNPINCDYAQDNPSGLHEIGMFPVSRTCDIAGMMDYSRNPRRSEYVVRINEYSEQSLFTGFDDEKKRYTGEMNLRNDSDTLARNRRPGNRLHMPENQIVEIIAGNLIDINGNILDINHNSVVLGSDGRTPRDDERTLDEILSVETRLKSRREVGYHFQLSTNTLSTDESGSSKNFIFDVDKEGLLKVNIPKSSSTGNIPFASTSNYVGGGDALVIKYDNESKLEPVPITLWSDVLRKAKDDDNAVKTASGELRKILLPAITGYESRSTGVDYINADAAAYFPNKNDGSPTARIRVNSTKYHNMYAAAEKLISNRIDSIKTTIFDMSKRNLSKSVAKGRPFELLALTDRDGNEELTTKYPANRSVVVVNPGEPAICPGGYETVVAGSNKHVWDSYSNSFSTTVEGGNGKAEQSSKGLHYEKTLDPGGKSANINLEGSLEMSVGKDHHDQKSIVLDTAGSLIAWLGADKNGRSAVVQTDGEVLINIGGSYGPAGHSMEFKNPAEDSRGYHNNFNPGRLDLRVNVNDNGFVGTGVPPEPSTANKPYAGDYIISISREWLVIAGCNTGTPMIIRNDGNINIEATDKLTLYGGVSVEMIDGHQKPKTITGTPSGG
jgi:hypothetical protein